MATGVIITIIICVTIIVLALIGSISTATTRKRADETIKRINKMFEEDGK